MENENQQQASPADNLQTQPIIQQPVEQKPPKSKRFNILLLLTPLLLLLVVGIVYGYNVLVFNKNHELIIPTQVLHISPTFIPTQIVRSNTKTYKSDFAKISFDYPENFELKEGSPSAVFVVFIIDDDKVMWFQKGEDRNLKYPQMRSSEVLNSITWDNYEATDAANGAYFTTKEGYEYKFVYPGELKNTLKSILQTFKFLSK